MNKKSFSLVLLMPLLASCNNAIPLEFKEYSSFVEPLKTFYKEEGDIYYKNDFVKPYEVDKIEGVNVKTNIYSYSSLNDLSLAAEKGNYSAYSYNEENLNDVINQHLLVVPVYFTDSSVNNNEELKETKKILLENAFFGDSSYTFYESVASYYNKSSYGHLKINGEVLPWLSINQSAEEALKEGGGNPEKYSDKVCALISTYLKDNRPDILDTYCSNHQGIIDSVYIIYDYPYQNDKKNNEDSLFWAYTYHCKNSGAKEISNYSWSSFDFLGNDVIYNHQVNASTYIHEMGHQFGLLDYYNKGNYSSYQPLGFMDMMDYNLGDHSPLSKYLLNWVSPMVLDMKDKEVGEIHLRPFSESGDFILIPSTSYNGTAYDRYLLISYFTPTGLNNLKNFPSYIYYDENNNQNIFTYPNKSGLLVYEVDARLAYYHAIRSYQPVCYIDETPSSGDYVIDFYHKNEINNPSRDYPLYHLLESSGENSFIHGKGASNQTLFRLYSTFGVDTYLDLANEFNISFRVSKVTSKETIVSFSRFN